MLCRSVVVVQTRRRCPGALSLFVVVVLLFVVLLFFLSCSITQNFQDLVLYDVHSLTLRCRLKASPLFVRFLMGVASVSSADASVKRGGGCRFLVPWETGSNRSSWRRWAALELPERGKSNCSVVVCFSLGSVVLVLLYF